MESIFNIFGSQQETMKLQKSVSSSGTFLDVGPLKQRTKSDSSNVYGKKVLGDIRNTLQQTNKKVDSDDNGPIKGKLGEDSAFTGCSRTPLLPKSQGVPKTVHKVFEKSLKNQTPAPKKFLEVPKTVHKLPNLKTKGKSTLKSGTPSLKSSKFSPVFREMVAGSPELQGKNPVAEDFDSLTDLAKVCETEVSSADPDPEPEIQGPAPFNEDSDEDIWPVSERPVLDDFKRIMVFWDSSKQPEEFEPISVPEPVKDEPLDLDINLVLPLVEDVDMNVMAVPFPALQEE